MDVAKSLYLFGEIIDAAESDYEDYKKLGLVCPCCYEPVFLVKRNKHNKYNKTQQYFAHYKKNETSQNCESRCSSEEFKKLIKFSQTKSRKQRLKLFEQSFKDIFFDAIYKKLELHVRRDKEETTIQIL